MAENQIKRINHTHEAIINWLIANPDRYLQDAAAFFNVTQAWLSVVVNSDAFQEKLRQRQDAVFGLVALGMRDKIAGAAHIGVEKVARHLETSEDKDYVLNATDKLLKAMGYGGKQVTVNANQTNVTNNTLSVSAEDLRLAREQRALQIGAPQGGQEKTLAVVEESEVLEGELAIPAFDMVQPLPVSKE